MKKYFSYQDFLQHNELDFNKIQFSTIKLKSLQEISTTGFVLETCEMLCFDYLNLGKVCTDLMFGLSASVNDAKTKIKAVEGMFFRDSTAKSAADKAKLVQCSQDYLDANSLYNELNDLYEYLLLKKKDLESAYYYYRELSNRK